MKKQTAKQYGPEFEIEEEYAPFETTKNSPMKMSPDRVNQSVKEDNIVHDYSSDSCSDINEKLDVISIKPTMQLDTVSMASSIYSIKVIKNNNETNSN